MLALVAGGEERADVAEPGRAEHGVDRARVRARRRRSARRGRGRVEATPPSTSGTPRSSACASTPIPTRISGARVRQVTPSSARSRLRSRGCLAPSHRASHPATRSRSARRRHLEQPLVALDDLDAAAVRLDERRAVGSFADRRRRAARSADATNACGVCTVTSSSRSSVSAPRRRRTRLTVSATGRPGTAPSKPSPSAASTRSITSSGTQRPRRVVDEDHRRVVGHLGDARAHRLGARRRRR